MPKKLKLVVLLFLALFIGTIIYIYYNYFWHYPRSRQYEAKLIAAIENFKLKGDTLSTFRLDSIMNFDWYKVVYVGAYLDVPDATHKCNINFSVLKTTSLNDDERFSGFLFLNEENKPVKFLQIEGFPIYGFDAINKIYPCGATKQNAIFQLYKYKDEHFYRMRFAAKRNKSKNDKSEG